MEDTPRYRIRFRRGTIDFDVFGDKEFVNEKYNEFKKEMAGLFKESKEEILQIHPKDIPKPEKENKQKTGNLGGIKIPGNVIAMLRRNGLDEKDLEHLFILDHEPILPIYKIDFSKTSSAQIHKVFMILLENALLTNNFKAEYAEIRETCKEEGLYDGNFATNLKKNHNFFKGAIKHNTINEQESVELSGEGLTMLAGIIKTLNG